MTKLSYAFSMLAPTGSAAARFSALGLAATAGALAMGPGAHATELMGTWTSGDFSDTFYLQSNGGVPDGSADGYYITGTTAADYIDFAITGDAYGYTAIVFGDGATGYNDNNTDGFVGIGYGQPGPFVNVQAYDSMKGPSPLKQPIYSGSPTGFVLQPGTYIGDFNGGTLTLSAVPEPDAWALLVAGAALAGGAARFSRRRRQPASAIA
jgi:hypothetical protein